VKEFIYHIFTRCLGKLEKPGEGHPDKPRLYCKQHRDVLVAFQQLTHSKR